MLTKQEAHVLPYELHGELGIRLGLRDIAAWSATHSGARSQLWNCHEVWLALAKKNHLRLMPMDGAGLSCAAEIREAFRINFFRINGRRLRALPRDNHCAILEEAAHMASGMMPCDGYSAVEELCTIAERALDSHDPSCSLTACAADRFLEVIQRDLVMFTDSMVERLEHACTNARQIHVLMVSSMQRHWAQSVQDIEESFWSQVVASGASAEDADADSAHLEGAWDVTLPEEDLTGSSNETSMQVLAFPLHKDH